MQIPSMRGIVVSLSAFLGGVLAYIAVVGFLFLYWGLGMETDMSRYLFLLHEPGSSILEWNLERRLTPSEWYLPWAINAALCGGLAFLVIAWFRRDTVPKHAAETHD